MKTKTFGFFILCFVLSVVSSHAQVSTTPAEIPAPKPSYAELLDKVKKNDLTIDFKALRFAFADTDASYADTELAKKMNAAYSEKDYKKSLKFALEHLDKSYVNIRAHIIAYNSYKQQGKLAESDFHNKVAVALINSIANEPGTDGKSEKTAWNVIEVAEEYVILSVLGYQMSSQSTMKIDGHQYDVLDVVNLKTQEKSKIYFNVDEVFAGYNKIFKK